MCGPLLFVLYINDMSRSLNNCKVSLYADDTVLYYSSNNLDQAKNEVKNDLAALSNWCDINKLTINCKKKAKYGNIIYSGTTKTNLDKLDSLFYRGLRICDASNNNVSKIQLCHECKITPLDKKKRNTTFTIYA